MNYVTPDTQSQTSPSGGRRALGIDLFAGAGGMSLGAQWAGLQIVHAIEHDETACQTYSANHPSTTVTCKDIRDVNPTTLSFVPEGTLVLFGGPPCSGFSSSNKKTRDNKNSNNWLFQEVLRFAEALNPDWVVLENVQGLVETLAGYFVNKIVSGLEKQGYTVVWSVLDATHFGVPQSRRRLFIVAHKENVEFAFPDSRVKVPVTVRDAIYDLPKVCNGSSVDQMDYSSEAQSDYSKEMRGDLSVCGNNLVTRNSELVLERYSYVPEGGNWSDIPEHLMANYNDCSRCHTGIYRRLRLDAPSIVIGNFRKNMLIHPTEDRGLSVREAARLQSFPGGCTSSDENL